MKSLFSVLTLIVFMFITSCNNTTEEETRPSFSYEEFNYPDPVISAELLQQQKADSIKWASLDATFPNKEVKQFLADTFYLTPSSLLAVQSFALANEQGKNYDYSWDGVSVGYGMMPLAGNYWERINGKLGYATSYANKEQQTLFQKAKKYLFYKIIANRSSQQKIYQWAKSTIDSAWISKPDTAQALDMFALWKCEIYLQKYNHSKETVRAKTLHKLRDYSSSDTLKYYLGSTFTSNDWYGRPDSDAKIYAFWYRRIQEHVEIGVGFSLDDARYWVAKGFNEMRQLAKPNSKKIFDTWKNLWVKGKITSVVIKDSY